MMIKRMLPPLLLVFASWSHASVLLTEGKSWRLDLSGFLEADATRDSRPSFLESAGSYAVEGPYTPPGRAGAARNEYSVRNSRLGLTLAPAELGTWKPKAYVEFDFLGNRASWEAGKSDQNYFNDPVPRFRHYYLSAEYEGWQLLTGQYWTLLGWGPQYFITTVSVAPGPGMIYQRTKQVRAIRDFVLSDGHDLQLGFAFEKASQHAGGTPNLEFGARYAYSGLRSGFASASGEIGTEPLSLALTGTMRRFATGATNSIEESSHKVNAYAGALDLLLPIIPSRDGKSAELTLTLTSEASTGTGYGDALPGWTANLPAFPYDSRSEETYLSEGQGAFDASGDFHLYRLVTWNFQLQYHLPWASFATAGHSELGATNLTGLGPVPPGQRVYDKARMDFINLFHDVSARLRLAAEYGRFTTHYLDGANLSDERYQLSAFYRF